MMKCEFEALTGKEVSDETFKMYEAMYLALPDNIGKVDFVSMINIKAIPESEEAIYRRMEKEQLIHDIKQQIADLEEKIKYEQRNIAYCKCCLEEVLPDEKEWVKDYKRWIACSKRIISQYRAEIKQLKQIIA